MLGYKLIAALNNTGAYEKVYYITPIMGNQILWIFPNKQIKEFKRITIYLPKSSHADPAFILEYNGF